MPLNTVSISDLHAMLATVQARVQRAAVLVSKRQALPESDPVRPHLIWLADLALARHQAAQRLLVQKIKEAEIEGAERLLAVAQSPAVVAALEAEAERLRGQLALIAGL